MAEWWYWTLYKCPNCGVRWQVYCPRGDHYDSGPSGSTTYAEECEECFAERQRPDLEEQEAQERAEVGK